MAIVAFFCLCQSRSSVINSTVTYHYLLIARSYLGEGFAPFKSLLNL